MSMDGWWMVQTTVRPVSTVFRIVRITIAAARASSPDTVQQVFSNETLLIKIPVGYVRGHNSRRHNSRGHASQPIILTLSVSVENAGLLERHKTWCIHPNHAYCAASCIIIALVEASPVQPHRTCNLCTVSKWASIQVWTAFPWAAAHQRCHYSPTKLAISVKIDVRNQWPYPVSICRISSPALQICDLKPRPILLRCLPKGLSLKARLWLPRNLPCEHAHPRWVRPGRR